MWNVTNMIVCILGDMFDHKSGFECAILDQVYLLGKQNSSKET